MVLRTTEQLRLENLILGNRIEILLPAVNLQASVRRTLSASLARNLPIPEITGRLNTSPLAKYTERPPILTSGPPSRAYAILSLLSLLQGHSKPVLHKTKFLLDTTNSDTLDRPIHRFPLGPLLIY